MAFASRWRSAHALSGGVASFEQNDVPRAGAFGPPLKFQQLDLQQTLLALVLATRHALVVRIALTPGLDRIAVLVQQDGIVVVLVVNGVPKIAGRQHVEIELGHNPKLSRGRLDRPERDRPGRSEYRTLLQWVSVGHG